jgi:RND family efflux transporter MFP subunit
MGSTNLPRPDRAPRPRIGRTLQIFAGVVAVALVIAFVVVEWTRSNSATELAQATSTRAALLPSVVVATAEPSPPLQSLTLPGETAAWFESTIYARVSGYVDKWFVDIGDHVTKGEVLATIDTPEVDAELEAARAKLTAVDAEVRVRQAAANFAKTTYDRWRDSPKGVVSDQERESKRADYDSAVAQLNAASANVNVDQADVDRLAALIAFKKVTAPFDGIITERRIDIGNLVTAGSTASTTSLYKMSQNDPMRVFVDAPQSVAADMVVGLTAKVTANDLPNRTFAGRIVRTAQAIDPRARTMRVEIDLPNRDAVLVPGMYVQVALELKSRGGVQVPAAAMVFRGDQPQVVVVEASGAVRFRKVEIARDDGNVVEIGAGLAPGDRIALNIGNEIVDGDKVAAVAADLRPAIPPPARADR